MIFLVILEGIDIRILAAIISATVAIFIAVLNHFIIDPNKQKRKRKRDQLNYLYAPLYSLLNLRMEIVIGSIATTQKFMLGGVKGDELTTKEYMIRFFLEKAGYASDTLIQCWTEYGGNLHPSDENTNKFIRTVVKEYNQLKKELGIKYNQIELETGVPSLLVNHGFNIENFIDKP